MSSQPQPTTDSTRDKWDLDAQGYCIMNDLLGAVETVKVHKCSAKYRSAQGNNISTRTTQRALPISAWLGATGRAVCRV